MEQNLSQPMIYIKTNNFIAKQMEQILVILKILTNNGMSLSMIQSIYVFNIIIRILIMLYLYNSSFLLFYVINSIF